MIKILILDVDGTLTDGSIYVGEQGEVFKRFHCRDGLAVLFLQQVDIIPIIITARESKSLLRRAQELKIKEIFQNEHDKSKLLAVICEKYDVRYNEIAYIGDDLNDLRAMKQCGLKMCPKDAHPKIRAICDYIAPSNGGQGAVRDSLEYLFQIIGHYGDFISFYS